MNNLNDFNKIVSSYVNEAKQQPNEPEEKQERLVIDIRPHAEVGHMVLTKATNDEERQEYIAAMMAGIAELMAEDLGCNVEGLAVMIAETVSDLYAQLYAEKIWHEML